MKYEIRSYGAAKYVRCTRPPRTAASTRLEKHGECGYLLDRGSLQERRMCRQVCLHLKPFHSWDLHRDAALDEF